MMVIDNNNANLRINDASRNAHKQQNTTSKYYKVSFDKSKLLWGSRIHKNNKRYFIGRYDIEVKAAIAFNLKATQLYGEFANLNKISEEDINNYYQEVYDKIKDKL